MNSRWHPRRLLRFSLGALLFVMLAACIGLGSYSAGRKAGESQRYAESFFVKVYPFADLAAQAPDDAARRDLHDDLVGHLKTTVAPASWESVDGNGQSGEIYNFSDNSSLVIHQSGAVHDQIDAALTTFRDEQTAAQFEQAVATVDSLVAEENDEPVVLVSFPINDKLAPSAVEVSYDNLVRRLTTSWGKPRFCGQCFDRGFPAWSLAQSIAHWSKRGGDVYIAIQDRPNQGRVIVGGWRRRN